MLLSSIVFFWICCQKFAKLQTNDSLLFVLFSFLVVWISFADLFFIVFETSKKDIRSNQNCSTLLGRDVCAYIMQKDVSCFYINDLTLKDTQPWTRSVHRREKMESKWKMNKSELSNMKFHLLLWIRLLLWVPLRRRRRARSCLTRKCESISRTDRTNSVATVAFRQAVKSS